MDTAALTDGIVTVTGKTAGMVVACHRTTDLMKGKVTVSIMAGKPVLPVLVAVSSLVLRIITL
jgi:hypothetical protein